jgi:hypothetical protein
MPESEIFDQIRNDYVVAENADDTVADTLKKFCEYAKTWFAKNGIIGVGQTSQGFAFRFQDGTERVLFSPNQRTVADQPAMSISGNSGGPVRMVAPMTDTSFKITG